MIVLFTDFGPTGPYVGQVEAVLCREAPEIPVVELMSDAPTFNPRAAAYLLAALIREFPKGTVFLCIVDPGVGSESRMPIVVEVDGQWFVGPANGLFNVVAVRGSAVRWWEITWRPERLSSTFHGRDLFAPVAAALAYGKEVPGRRIAHQAACSADWPTELCEVIYIDHFGNAMTGIRACTLDKETRLVVEGIELPHGRTYADHGRDQAFWYENSNGLVEIAINQGNAAARFGIRVGASVTIARRHDAEK